MTTPIGHSLAGVIVFLMGSGLGIRRSLWLFVLLLAAATASDIDYFPILWGDLAAANLGHQGLTHSLIFATAVALVLAATAAAVRLGGFVRLLPFFIAAAWSHLLLDMLTYDGNAPVGIMLLWPWEVRFHGPVEVFGGFAKASFADMLSWHNALVIGGEIAILGAVALAVWLVAVRRRGDHE